MKSTEDRKGLEGASYRELRLLEEVESYPELSQRTLASSLGIALGVVNVLVKSLVRRGYIKATRVGWKRWAYVMTPAGVARKVNLTVSYVDRFMDHYRRVRTIVRDNLDTEGIGSDALVGIYGTTEVAEIIYLSLRDAGVVNIHILDDKAERGHFLGLGIKSLGTVNPEDYSRVMVAFSDKVESRRNELLQSGFSLDQVVTLVPETNLNRVDAMSEAADS